MSEINQEFVEDFERSCASFYRAFNFRAATEHLRTHENYDVLDIIGRGEIGKVVKIQDKTTKEEYAAKINVSGILFREELQVWPLLHNDNILKLHDAIPVPNTRAYVLVTDLAIGTLAKAFQDNEKNQMPNKLNNVKKWFSGVLKGLSYLHEKGFTHLDITDRNVLISKDSESVIADFNYISKATAPVDFCGVPFPYPPPELWRSEYRGKPVDAKSVDLYTCGVMFLELCANYRLYLKLGRSEERNFKKEVLPLIRHQIMCLDWTAAAFYPKTFGGQTKDVEELSHLISLLVKVLPKKRISAEMALKHNFFQLEDDENNSESVSEMTSCCRASCVKSNLLCACPKTCSARKSDDIQEQDVIHNSDEENVVPTKADSCSNSEEVSPDSEMKDHESNSSNEDPEKEKKSKKRRILSWLRKKARRISNIFKK